MPDQLRQSVRFCFTHQARYKYRQVASDSLIIFCHYYYGEKISSLDQLISVLLSTNWDVIDIQVIMAMNDAIRKSAMMSLGSRQRVYVDVYWCLLISRIQFK